MAIKTQPDHNAFFPFICISVLLLSGIFACHEISTIHRKQKEAERHIIDTMRVIRALSALSSILCFYFEKKSPSFLSSVSLSIVFKR
jgi:hypothetical protein